MKNHNKTLLNIHFSIPYDELGAFRVQSRRELGHIT